MLTGARLSRYEIKGKIGSGGMGEVYLAHDEQLDRKVALKVLLPEFCCNQERVQRFKLEARAASALNHPNIITIYEVGEQDDRLYIATEYVDGVTLREKIEGGKLTLLDSVKIAEQIADALAAAHEAHIVHRDIKPENIMIRRRDGYAKILDFGLAKAILQSGADADDKTLQLVQTQAGLVMGSVRYMSPEQARGKDIDGRSDIWSLGVVLYEMVAGKNPFDGETVSDSLAAVIHVEPEPLEGLPDELERIIKKTLRKDSDERYQSVKDLALDLKDFRQFLEHNSGELKFQLSGNYSKTLTYQRQDTSENKTLIHHTLSVENTTGENKNKTRVLTAAPRRQGLLSARYLPILILFLAGILAAGAWIFQPFSAPKLPNTFESVQISRITDNGKAGFPAISPDGKYVAFVNFDGGLNSLTVRQVATGSSVQVVPPTNLKFFPPTFSNDGNYVFYTIVDKAVGTLYQIPSLGGTPKKLIVDVDSKISFSPDGNRLAFVRHNPDQNIDTIFLANSDGTNPQPFISTTEAGVKTFSEISWSPNGEKLLFGSIDKVLVDQIVNTKLYTISLNTKEIVPFDEKAWLNANSFCWVKDGSGIFLLAKKTEQEQQQIWFLSYPEGEARQITNDSSGYVLMSYSDENKTIAALKTDVISSLWSHNLQSKEFNQITSESRDMLGANGVKQLPDGKILVAKAEGGNQVNFWTVGEDGKNEVQLTKDLGFNLQPVISPDNRFMVFTSNRSGDFRIWRMNIDGKNPVQITNSTNDFDVRPKVLPDNKTVVFERRFEDKMKSVLMKTTIDGGPAEPVFPDSPTNNMFPSISADGKYFAYTAQSFDSKNLVFNSNLKISPIKDGAIKAPEREINTDLGYNYLWAPDNKNLFFINRQGVPNLFSVALEGTSQPKPLTNFNSGTILNFDFSRDGKRLFLVRGIINSDLILIKDTAKTT